MGLITGLLVGLSALGAGAQALEARKARKQTEADMKAQAAAAENEASRESLIKSREADIQLSGKASDQLGPKSLAVPTVKKKATKSVGALSSPMTGGLSK